MYTYEFREYNPSFETFFMSEETTLNVLLTNEFDVVDIADIPEKFRLMAPNEWAKYAFENNKTYHILYYKNNKPYVSVTNSKMYFSLDYYNQADGGISQNFTIIFGKGYIDNEFIFYDNNCVFLKEIIFSEEYGKTILFYSHKKKDNTFLEEWIEEDGKPVLVDQWGTADLSKHWFEAPKHFLDFERFLDYKNLLEPEYFDLPQD